MLQEVKRQKYVLSYAAYMSFKINKIYKKYYYLM